MNPNHQEQCTVMTKTLNERTRLATIPVTHEDHLFMPVFSSECVGFIKHWDMPENSVFISCFPKTGKTWCAEIVRYILYLKDEKALRLSECLPTWILNLEAGSRDRFDFMVQLELPRRYFSLQISERLFNFNKMKEKNGKMIYVIRNPKDQLVSWFHFIKKLPLSEELRNTLGKEWNEYFDLCIKGQHPMGVKRGDWYLDHILGWLKHRDDPNFLIVEYECLKQDFPKEIARIAEFLQVKLSNDDIEKVASACSLEGMRKSAEMEERGFFKTIIRKGEVGNWKNYLTVAQSELIDRMVEDKLKGTGITFTYSL